ncbi:MAG: hypothetical protein QM400_09620 [Spirochaetota bacterium]|jgi:hypothetical protein|nr:hypothetical protein [Spirochaetota bacterium]
MSQWGFHSYPEREDCPRDEKRLRLSYFDSIRNTGGYMIDPTGQEELFNELRMNPHRFNLARVGFVFEAKKLEFQYISDIEQILDLWKGELHSRFSYKDHPIEVYIICDPEVDALGIHVFSPLLDQGRLAMRIVFPTWQVMYILHMKTVPGLLIYLRPTTRRCFLPLECCPALP